ncbi:MAG: hypothetical protein OEM97_08630 [Acidimicrobiia bacterium]|nr:hypothetical protein [Acidimicrobiia bacterium]
MAMPMTIPLGVSERVAEAVGDICADRRDTMRVVGLTDLVHGLGVPAGTLCLVLDSSESVEIILSLGANPTSLRSPIAVLIDEGWVVTVLVPSERLGEAHHGLRGSECLLQPWWIEDDDLQFGGYERP